MKKQLSISIESPCNQKWENFKVTSQGGFCASCQKDVVDFTNMSNREILETLSKNSGNTCGRFRAPQLEQTYSPLTESSRFFGSKWMQTGMASLSILLASHMGYAQHSETKPKNDIIQLQVNPHTKPVSKPSLRTISGTVVDEYGDSLPGVIVVLKGTSQGTNTDIDGKFSFSVDVNSRDKLVFSFIGYVSQEYVIKENDLETLSISMVMDQYELMGDIAIEEIYSSEPSEKRSLWSKIKAWL